MRKAFLLFLALVMVSTTFIDAADARRKRRRTRTKKLKVINEKKLFERIGTNKGVSDIVDEWFRLNLADSRVSAVFAIAAAEPSRLAKMRKEMNDRICELSDGPCKAKSQELKALEGDKKVSDDQFLAISENLFKSLEKQGTPEREKNELLARVGEWRDESLQDSEPAANTDPNPQAAVKPLQSPALTDSASHMSTSRDDMDAVTASQSDQKLSEVFEQR